MVVNVTCTELSALILQVSSQFFSFVQSRLCEGQTGFVCDIIILVSSANVATIVASLIGRSAKASTVQARAHFPVVRRI